MYIYLDGIHYGNCILYMNVQTNSIKMDLHNVALNVLSLFAI